MEMSCASFSLLVRYWVLCWPVPSPAWAFSRALRIRTLELHAGTYALIGGACADDTVKMLDDLHKGYVVTITATYVKAQERTPAAHVAKQVFAHMEKSGWGTSRLIDATWPMNKANVARTEFRAAVEKLNAGESY